MGVCQKFQYCIGESIIYRYNWHLGMLWVPLYTNKMPLKNEIKTSSSKRRKVFRHTEIVYSFKKFKPLKKLCLYFTFLKVILLLLFDRSLGVNIFNNSTYSTYYILQKNIKCLNWVNCKCASGKYFPKVCIYKVKSTISCRKFISSIMNPSLK